MSRFDRLTAGVVLVLVAAVALTVLIASLRPETVSTAQIAYLAPARSSANIWLVNPAQPENPQQLTFSATGVFDFAVSKDGNLIAYAEQQPGKSVFELMLLDRRSGSTRQLTNCAAENATCTTPAWRPDGQVLAYERTELNDPMGNVSRVWLLDLSREPLNTFPLFSQADVLGNDPKWSGDGQKLAFYDAATQAVLVYNFAAAAAEEQLIALPSANGSSGAISPDGTHLVFPELLITTPTRAIMRLANLITGDFRSLTPQDDETEDRAAAWHPDGQHIVVGRRYLDNRFTVGDQLYEVDTLTGELQPLIIDPTYQHSSPAWSPDGSQLVLHRYQIQGANDRTTPEIWLYDPQAKTLVKLVDDGFYPVWVYQP